MATDYYLMLFLALLMVGGMTIIGPWWNHRQGLDENGNPIAGRPQHGADG